MADLPMYEWPIIGSIYHDDSKMRTVAPPAWEDRDAALLVLSGQRSSAFDAAHERNLDALIDLLGWHQPWMRWEQTFEPHYIGDRFLGAGCRICGFEGGASQGVPCYTARVIAAHVLQQPSDLTRLAWPNGRP